MVMLKIQILLKVLLNISQIIQRFVKQCHSVLVEYPTYGVYKSKKINEARLFEDSLTVYDFMVNQMHFKPENIIIFGRSIGTAMATYLASMKRCFLLILFSPFTSARNIAWDKAHFFSYFLKDRFRNDKHILNVQDSVFIVHGKSDKIIEVRHSLILYEKIMNPRKFLVTPELMTHNEFSFDEDFLRPLMKSINVLEEEIQQYKIYEGDKTKTSVNLLDMTVLYKIKNIKKNLKL